MSQLPGLLEQEEAAPGKPRKCHMDRIRPRKALPGQGDGHGDAVCQSLHHDPRLLDDGGPLPGGGSPLGPDDSHAASSFGRPRQCDYVSFAMGGLASQAERPGHHPCRLAPEPQRALRCCPSDPQNQQDGPDFLGGLEEPDSPGKNPAARGGATHLGHAPLRAPLLPGYPRRESQGEGRLVAGGRRAAGSREDPRRTAGRLPGKAPTAESRHAG